MFVVPTMVPTSRRAPVCAPSHTSGRLSDVTRATHPARPAMFRCMRPATRGVRGRRRGRRAPPLRLLEVDHQRADHRHARRLPPWRPPTRPRADVMDDRHPDRRLPRRRAPALRVRPVRRRSPGQNNIEYQRADRCPSPTSTAGSSASARTSRCADGKRPARRRDPPAPRRVAQRLAPRTRPTRPARALLRRRRGEDDHAAARRATATRTRRPTTGSSTT